MNLLSDPTLPDIQPNLFELGATIESKTRGVWGYVVPHDTDPANKAVLLLDFEGMYDPSGQRRNPNFDAQIFLLAVLVSSSFVYNTNGQIQANNLEQLKFVTNLGKHMEINPGVNAIREQYVSHFPDQFTWTVRDFFLGFTPDITTDNQYLEKMLKQEQGSTDESDVFHNDPTASRRS